MSLYFLIEYNQVETKINYSNGVTICLGQDVKRYPSGVRLDYLKVLRAPVPKKHFCRSINCKVSYC